MRQHLILLVSCVLTGGIACATAWTWLTLTRHQVLSPGGVIVCTGISVALALAVEHAIQRARRGGPRRIHARPHPAKNRKGS